MKNILVPYLFFNSNCKEAMEFYHGIFGGKLDMQTHAEAGYSKDPALRDLIIHAQLKTDTLIFMGSDGMPTPENKDGHIKIGDNVQLCFVDTDEAKLREYFDKLAEGGTVTSPLKKEFWGDIFGAVRDKFNVEWMFNIEGKKE